MVPFSTNKDVNVRGGVSELWPAQTFVWLFEESCFDAVCKCWRIAEEDSCIDQREAPVKGRGTFLAECETLAGLKLCQPFCMYC